MEQQSERMVPVVLKTKTTYQIPSDTFMLPLGWRRYHLSQLINKVLNLPNPVPFDFIINGDLLSSSVGEWCASQNIGEEETLEIEYIPSALPPEQVASIPQPEWVSAVSARQKGVFLAGSYDTSVRIFGQDKEVIHTISGHTGPVSSVCWIPSSSSAQEDSNLFASASYDTTGRIVSVPSLLSHDSDSTPKALASLHLHSAPLSSISANASGTHLLTASWDKLVGLWSTSIPTEHELAAPSHSVVEPVRKKRRVAATESAVVDDAKRKAPAQILKSHTGRVSKALFSVQDDGKAFSAGWDCTLRSWDLEVGLCTNTTTSPERVMQDMALSADGSSAFVACADRHVLMYSLNNLETSAKPILFPHPSAPTSIASHPSSPHHFITSAQDGIVRIWDSRSSKVPIAQFPGYEEDAAGAKGGKKKVLSVDWAAEGLVVSAGEAGIGITRAGIA